VTLPGSAFTPGRSLDRWSQVMADIGGATGSGVAVLVNRPGRTASIMSCVVAAVHELPDDIEVLLNAAACARALAGTLLLVHAVPLSFAERSVGLDAALARGRATLGTGTQILARTGPSVPATTRLLRAHPHELICQVVEADLVVVGGAPIGSSTTLGLVTASAILHATSPVLVVPRLPGLQQ
jgi:nucleotide-binding universal stress UspA family protein